VPKNPLGKIKDAAGLVTGTVVDGGQKVVGQAVGAAVDVVGAVSAKVPGRKRPAAARPEAPSVGRAVPQEASTRPHGDPVKPSAPPSEKAPVKKTAAKKTTAKTAPAKKAAAKKAPAKKTPAKKLASAGAPEIPTPDETALAKKAGTARPAKKAAVKKTAAKKTATKKAPGQSSD